MFKSVVKNCVMEERKERAELKPRVTCLFPNSTVILPQLKR